jgi:hypothetical protein
MGLCPKPRVWGELIIFRRKRKPRKPKILEPLRLWSGARPFSPLGEEPVGRLGVLVPLGTDAYIASCAVENRHAPIGGCLVQMQIGTMRRQEETRFKVIHLPEPSILKSGNFVALKR